MNFFFFNKDNKSDIVVMPLFGELPRWRACCISYVIVSMLALVLFLEYTTSGWWGVATISLGFSIFYALGRWGS